MDPLDLNELKRQGYMMVDFLVDYHRNVANYPVMSQVQPGYLRKLLPSSAPSNPETFDTILSDVKDHIVPGIEEVNSFSFNAHKWFLTNVTCCCLWVKDSSCLTNSLSTNPQYLRNQASESNQVIDYKDWQIALSRKFQSLKLWFVLRSYGLNNLRSFLRNHVDMAKTFENLMKQDTRFEIFVPRYFSLVCFRVSPLAITNKKKSLCGNHHNHDHDFNGKIMNDADEHVANEINSKLLDLINASGKVFMTHGRVGGAFVIRCAVGATLTEEQHVIMAWKIVQEQATSVLSKLSKA